jgi:hypothetical protein
MRPDCRAATWVLLAALCGACGSRPLPNDGAGGMAGSTGGGTGGGARAGTGGGAGGLSGAGATTSAAGVGGAAGVAGAPADRPECPPATAPGMPCATVGSSCDSVVCSACSDQYWRLVRQGPAPCVCTSPGVWMCAGVGPGGPIGDCFFDPPLDCAIAQSLYEDASCQTHPPCSH